MVVIRKIELSLSDVVDRNIMLFIRRRRAHRDNQARDLLAMQISCVRPEYHEWSLKDLKHRMNPEEMLFDRTIYFTRSFSKNNAPISVHSFRSTISTPEHLYYGISAIEATKEDCVADDTLLINLEDFNARYEYRPHIYMGEKLSPNNIYEGISPIGLVAMMLAAVETNNPLSEEFHSEFWNPTPSAFVKKGSMALKKLIDSEANRRVMETWWSKCDPTLGWTPVLSTEAREQRYAENGEWGSW